MDISTRQEINLQTDTSIDALIAYFISNREALQDDQDNFLLFNAELIGQLIEGFAESESVEDWMTVTEDELRKKLATQTTQEDTPSPIEQLKTIFDRLDDQGVTLNHNQGHTISVTKKDDTFYLYDSATGQLSKTNSSQELAKHLLAGKYASANLISIYVLTPIAPMLHEQIITEESIPLLTEVIDKYKSQLYLKLGEFDKHHHDDAASQLRHVLGEIEGAFDLAKDRARINFPLLPH